VDNAVGQTRTQLLAGNRLSGLQGLTDDFFGSGRAGNPAGQQDVAAVLAQIGGLNTQFGFGGQAGRNAVNSLNPGDIGGFLGRGNNSNLRVGAPSAALIGQPGTQQNDIARRLAESQGIEDTNGFIRDNQAQIAGQIKAASLRGVRAAPAGAGVRVNIDPTIADGGGDPFSQVFDERISQQNNSGQGFGILAQILPQGLQGLQQSGLLPSFLGSQNSLASQFTRNSQGVNAAQDLFSPLLFGR
jgi:hypothetical protein